LQGFLTVSSGKRIAPQLPKIVGAWLTGTFDSDKSVSRAALESFETAFPSEEKRKAVWRLYQGPLLSYVEDAIFRHTPQTLSDERSTSPDDAEAKYVRVVSISLLLLDQLLQTDLGDQGLSSNETFQAIVSAKKTWEFASHKDATVRRAVYKLVVDVVNYGIELNWKTISSCFLAKSLNISQASSSAQHINALLAITKAHPAVWTTEHVSKAAVSGRLYQYLRQGSQRGPEAWWLYLRELINSIPTNLWSSSKDESHKKLSYDSAGQLLSALHEGVINSNESRQNSVAAWSTYMNVFFWALDLLDEEDQRHQLLRSFLYPIIERYLLATSDLAQWTVPASRSLQLCSSSIIQLEKLYPINQFGTFYQNQVGKLVEAMRLSQPESSKNFKSSQDDLIQRARRFVDLQTAIETDISPKHNKGGAHVEHSRSNLSPTFIQSNIDLLSEAVKLLRDRKGKPYGAAGVIYIILDKRPEIIDEVKCSSTPLLLSGLLDEDVPKLLNSPSAELLVSILLKCRSMASFEKSFSAILEHFLRNEALRYSHAYNTLLRGIAGDDLRQHPDLVQRLLGDLKAALDGDDSRWPVVYEILNNQSLNNPQDSSELSTSQSIQSRMLEDMLSGLTLDGKEHNALKGLDFLLSHDASVRPLLASINIGTLLTRLLIMSDSENEENATKAARLASLVKKVLSKQGDTSTGASATEIIGRQLDGEGESISILSLVDIARETLQEGDKDQNATIASAIFPTAAHWQKALTPFTQLHPPPSISLNTPLQGCAYLIDRERRRSSGGLPRDSESFSVALRLTIFATKTLEIMSPEQLTHDQLQATYLYYPQALQVANDKLSIESSNALWIDATEEVVQEIRDTVANGQKLVHSWVRDGGHENYQDSRPTLISCWLSQLSTIRGTSVQAYNLARTFTSIMTEASDYKGASRYMLEWDTSLRTVKSSPDVLKSAALLAVCRDTLAPSALGKRLCNELVADATEVDLDNQNDGQCSRSLPWQSILTVHLALRRLVLLNLLIRGEEDLIGNVPSQRLIFLAKHLLSVTSFNQAPAGLQSELMSTLASILPPIKNLYGDFWQGAVALLTQYLSGIKDASEIVPLHSALRLHACLLSLTKGESNEDLEEELSKVKPSLEASLLDILKHFDGNSPSICF
jgi:E3 ubiquitin-protein ligase listerin